MKQDRIAQTVTAYKYLADQYVKQNSDRAHILPEIDRFTQYLPQNAKLLDLGCGVGFDSRDFNYLRPDLDILGIDISKDMLKHFKKIAPGIKYLQVNMITHNYPKSSFDGIWMNASLLHIPKEQVHLVLTKVISSLKPNGALYIRVKEGNGESFVPAANYGHKEINRFFAFYTMQELKKLLLSNRMTIMEWNSRNVKTTKWISIIAVKNSKNRFPLYHQRELSLKSHWMME